MKVTPLHKYYSEDHLIEVIEKMKTLGPPVLRGTHDPETDRWFAHEGTHRLRAAAFLNITPVMIHIPWPKAKKAMIRARYRDDIHVFKD